MDLFVTVFYCVLDPATGGLRYANAGHNPPYVRRADGSIEALDGTSGLVLGVMADAHFDTHQAALRAGDRLVLFTDGVVEACDPAGRAYGTERLVAELREHAGASAAAVVERICDSVTHFAGSTTSQADDITLSVLALDR
jgi:sigma-B regulation protein RsbU (phosphoserine phosphatase)